MKKLSLLLLALFFVSCEGDPGPVGPEGPQGPAGLAGQAFEVEANFNPSNNYGQIFSFPNNIEVLDTDIVMVYWLFEENEETGNDVWQQLPASYFFDDGGELQYTFDHTLADVQIFLQGDINLDTVGPGFTENQYFRVVILPVDYVKAKKIDMNNMKEVMDAVDKSKIQRNKL